MIMLILTEMRDASQNHRAEMRDLIRKQDEMAQEAKEDRKQHRAEMRELFRKQDETMQKALDAILKALERKVRTHQCS